MSNLVKLAPAITITDKCKGRRQASVKQNRSALYPSVAGWREYSWRLQRTSCQHLRDLEGAVLSERRIPNRQRFTGRASWSDGLESEDVEQESSRCTKKYFHKNSKIVTINGFSLMPRLWKCPILRRLATIGCRGESTSRLACITRNIRARSIKKKRIYNDARLIQNKVYGRCPEKKKPSILSHWR